MQIGKDKIKHFICGLFLGSFCIIFAVVGGFLKEYMDEINGGRFDWHDFIFTIIGGFVGQILSMYLIYKLLPPLF